MVIMTSCFLRDIDASEAHVRSISSTTWGVANSLLARFESTLDSDIAISILHDQWVVLDDDIVYVAVTDLRNNKKRCDKIIP